MILALWEIWAHLINCYSVDIHSLTALLMQETEGKKVLIHQNIES